MYKIVLHIYISMIHIYDIYIRMCFMTPDNEYIPGLLFFGCNRTHVLPLHTGRRAIKRLAAWISWDVLGQAKTRSAAIGFQKKSGAGM